MLDRVSVLAPPAPTAPAAPRPDGLGGGVRRGARRFVRGADTDPVWLRPALLILLAATAVLYIWGLGASGWANSFYSAAVQAGTKSWKAFFFGSSDAANFITVDKTPAFLWPMEILARLFGVNAWSILLPQALEGVAAVGLTYATVRRWFAPAAALLAGAVCALTPVAVLMFRFNNPDALLTLLMAAAAYATVRAVEDGRTRWLVAAGTAIGIGFLAKELEVLLVVPGLTLAYLVAAPTALPRRLWQLAMGAVAIVVSAGWWVAIVALWPASSRPYIGGSTDNSIFNVVFGYNGFGRLTGNETGSVVGGGRQGRAGQWGITGLTRLFGTDMGTQVSWLLPAALILLVVGLVLTLRTARTDVHRAALLIWGAWLLVAGVALSLGQGIIHPYYTVALAPPIGALIGIGAKLLWERRASWIARAVLAATLLASVAWAVALLDRTPTWHPELRTALVIAGVVVALALVLSPGRLAIGAATAAVAVGLAAPAAYSLATATTPHSGAIPSAGPTVRGRPGGFGGGGPGGFGGRGLGRAGLGRGKRTGVRRVFTFPGGGFTPPVGGFAFPGGVLPPGGFGGPPTQGGFRFGAGAFGGGGPFGGGGAFGPGGGFGGGGGLLNGSAPPAALTQALEAGSSHYRWVLAVVGSEDASGYQLATGDPVMSLGGFNGTDPAPTLAQFERYVAAGRIHYFIASGGFGGRDSTVSAITQWVTGNFAAQTIGGRTVYDLSPSPAGGT